MEKIKISLVDDQKLILDGIKSILGVEPTFEIVGTYNNPLNFLDSFEENPADVVLMDIRMPEMNGVEVTERLLHKFPDVCVLILTTFDEDEYIVDALSLGAKGYLLKDIDGMKLIESIKEAYNGDLLMSGQVAKRLAKYAKVRTHITGKNIDLTERELEIAKCLIEGMSSRDIADSLYLTQGTVKNYISNIYSKIGTNERVKAVQWLKNNI